MSTSSAICVYCGSSSGANPTYRAAGQRLGTLIAQAGYTLIYGGGNLGIMGTVAQSAVEAGGQAIEIIPKFMQARAGVLGAATEIIVTASMHERKQRMFEMADAFVALPGGIGTLEETVEMMTWRQLGQHAKPIIVIDVEEYWQPLQALLNHLIEHGFAPEESRHYYYIVATAEEAMHVLKTAL